jgi:AraC family transcriptional regulator
MDARVALITRVIAERRSGSLSAQEAGALLGLCEGYFLRLFKQEVGTTFRRYKREARIGAVVNLLRQNQASVKQIASVAGYEDASNFHRDFKYVQGMSPRQFRLMELSKRFPMA